MSWEAENTIERWCSVELATLVSALKPFPEALYVLSLQGIVMASNPAGTSMLGLSPEILTGRDIVDFVSDAPEKFMAYLARCSGNGQFVTGAVTWRGTNGSCITTKTEGALLRHGPGDYAYILLRCRPRTEASIAFLQLNRELAALKEARQQLEADNTKLESEVNARTTALKASELRCRGIVEAAADGIIIIVSDGTIDSANCSAAEMFGYSVEELVGRDISLLVPDFEFGGDIQSYLRERSRAEEIDTDRERAFSESIGRRKGGEEFHIEFSISGVQLGAEWLCIAVTRDITERKATEKQLATYANDLVTYTNKLERKNAELDQFAYVTSHDLKAPLRAIANLASWIEEDMDDKLEAGIRRQLELLRGRVYRMEGLIDGILQYSRVGRLHTELEMVDTQELVREVIDSLQPPDQFQIDVDVALPTFLTSRIWLQQVFANLISNAIKYHDRCDGKIEVAAEDAEEFYAFSVSDDGPGIDPKFHEKIFVIFQTLEARDTRESTGIGLTIVKKIIEEQGGTIEVESSLGKGTAFRFIWPKQSTLAR